MKLTQDGLTVWYGTPDAPAPLEEVCPRSGVSLVVGTHPAGPANTVHVRYRVDGGPVRIAPGGVLHTDAARDAQYFQVAFPPLPAGRVVEYAPVFGRAGRQVPGPTAGDRFPSKFFLADAAPAVAVDRVASLPAPAGGARYGVGLKFVACVTVRVDVQILGETPEGVRIDFFATGGDVVGPGFRANVYPGSADHLFVRPDGVGVIGVRAAMIASDGARFEVEACGSAEFGPDGYERARLGRLPDHCPIVLCPRILTGDARYLWLNRAQCVAAGETRLEDNVIEYDIYAAASRRAPKGGVPA